MRLNGTQLLEIVNRLRADRPLLSALPEDEHILSFRGPVVAKERPRSTSKGRVYTPKRTKDFEAAVAKRAKEENLPRVSYPIRVILRVFDSTSDPELAMLSAHGLTHNTKNDLDNIAKAVLDALNGVLWMDDKQISALSVTRVYSTLKEGFDLRYMRRGLNDSEFRDFMKLWNRSAK